eukprot:734347-Pyramimonas_sp.AAC.1
MRQNASGELRKRIVEAHRAGPAPPRVAAIRGRTCNAIRGNADLVHDPAFTLLGELPKEEFSQCPERNAILMIGRTVYPGRP